MVHARGEAGGTPFVPAPCATDAEIDVGEHVDVVPERRQRQHGLVDDEIGSGRGWRPQRHLDVGKGAVGRSRNAVGDEEDDQARRRLGGLGSRGPHQQSPVGEHRAQHRQRDPDAGPTKQGAPTETNWFHGLPPEESAVWR